MDKASTKGTLSKEGHRPYKEPALAGGLGIGSEDMNFDIDDEQISYSQPLDPFSSPPKPQEVDLVDWASSQPVVLKSLFSEAAKKPEKRPFHLESTWPNHDRGGPSIQLAPTSRNPSEGRTRPLRRTNSSARARLGPATSSTSKPPPSPDGALWGKDRLAVLAACQTVSERMDEHAFLQAAQGVASGSSKRKPISSSSTSRRASVPRTASHDRDNGDKSKQKVNLLSETGSSGAKFQRSVSSPIPIMESQLGVSFSSSSAGSSRETPSESPDTSMMDVDSCEKLSFLPNSSLVPPLSKRSPAMSTRSISTSSNSSLSTDTSRPVTPATSTTLAPAPSTKAEIQLHPLLTQKHPPPPRQKPYVPSKEPSPLTRRPPAPLPERQPPPLLSQSTRPPVLGMRRAHTAPVQQQQATRPKAFKPPLLSQPVHGQNHAAAPLAPAIPTHTRSRDSDHAPTASQATPTRSPSSETVTDADSSFDNLSFGMDVEMLELTMRQYD